MGDWMRNNRRSCRCDALETQYELGSESWALPDSLKKSRCSRVMDYWQWHQDELRGIVDGSFLANGV